MSKYKVKPMNRKKKKKRYKGHLFYVDKILFKNFRECIFNKDLLRCLCSVTGKLNIDTL